MRNYIFAAVLVTVLLSSGTSAEQIVLRYGQDGYSGSTDTFIDEQNPSANYGSQWYMQSYMSSDDPRDNSLVYFNLAGQLGGDIEIQSATLSLWVCELLDFTAGDAMQVGAYKINWNKDWSETQANWTYFKDTTAWATAGCENTTWDRAANPDSSLYFYNTSQVNRYYDWNVTSSVADWVENGAVNNGWLVRGVWHDGGTDGIKMNTNQGDLAYRPYLTINYTIIPEPATICLLSIGALFLKRRSI